MNYKTKKPVNTDFQRFKSGSLLMMSTKNKAHGRVLYYVLNNIFSTRRFDAKLEKALQEKDSDIAFGFPMESRGDKILDRGVPIFVYETPILVKRRYEYGDRTPEKYWQIKFIFDGKLCVMFLKEKQYNHELLKVVEPRMKKKVV
jgi:hypothetical protein